MRFLKPEGGAYVFAELGGVLRGRDCFDLLEACLDSGVVFAPGLGFGQVRRCRECVRTHGHASVFANGLACPIVVARS